MTEIGLSYSHSKLRKAPDALLFLLFIFCFSRRVDLFFLIVVKKIYDILLNKFLSAQYSTYC